MKIKRVETLDDVLKMFDIDKSKIVVDEEYMADSEEPAPWDSKKEKRKILIAGTYDGKWTQVVDCKDFFIFSLEGTKRPRRIDKASGQVSDYKIVVA